jgi:hypothetical protein
MDARAALIQKISLVIVTLASRIPQCRIKATGERWEAESRNLH